MKLNIQLFSSTNKTTNYELSQYIGTDKPTYLGDYNGDMSKIDANLKLVSDKANSGDTKGTQALASAELAQEKADSAYDLAEVANETATSANSTATTALNNSISNQNLLDKFNLSKKTTITRTSTDSDTVQCTFGKFKTGDKSFTNTKDGMSNIVVSLNGEVCQDGSVGKIYGGIYLTATYNISATTGYPCARLRCSDFGIAVPSETLDINSIGVCYCNHNTATVNITIKSDGYIYVYGALNGNVSSAYHRNTVVNSLLFFKPFGE